MIVLLLISLASWGGCENENYTDEFARKYMFPLSAAAYSDYPWLCLKHKFLGSKLIRQATVKCDGGECSGFLAVLHEEEAIVLSFRGTQGLLQLLEEAKQSAIMAWTAWSFGGRVSKYFEHAFYNVWIHGMEEDFKDLRERYPDYDVWVTGHSLGGAMAALAASHIVGKGLVHKTMVKLVTFGQPRVGDQTFASFHDQQIPFSYRVVRWRDLVPHIPSKDIYRYYHQGTEVFYTTSMYPRQFVICERDENKECSSSIWNTGVDDHLFYFNKLVSEYGKNGCYE